MIHAPMGAPGGRRIAQFVTFWLLEEPAWALGAVLLALPILGLRLKGRVAEGESYVETRALVETGIYAVVRHPQYLGWMVMYGPLVLSSPIGRWR